MPKTVIVGLGPSGLGCALGFTLRGKEFLAFEKERRAGGLAKSQSIDGFTFDCGPHVILGIPNELVDLFENNLSLDLVECSGESGIVMDGAIKRIIPTPFQRNLNYLPVSVRAKLLVGFAKVRSDRRGQIRNYQEFSITRCGKGVHDLFVKGYEEKRLRYALDEIPTDWTSRLQRSSLTSLLLPRWVTRLLGSNVTENRFLYPRSGSIEALPRALLGRLREGSIFRGRTLTQIDTKTKLLTFDAGTTTHYDQLVLGIPLPEIVACIKDAPRDILLAAENLVFTSVYVIAIGVDGPLDHAYTFLRFPDPKIGFYRLSFPTRYAPGSAPEGCSSVVGELSYHPSRYAVNEKEAREVFHQNVRDLGIIDSGRRILVERINNIRYGHVLYNHKTRASVRFILDYLRRNSIHTCGKYGQWRDMLMPQSIADGVSVADRICQDSDNAK